MCGTEEWHSNVYGETFFVVARQLQDSDGEYNGCSLEFTKCISEKVLKTAKTTFLLCVADAITCVLTVRMFRYWHPCVPLLALRAYSYSSELGRRVRLSARDFPLVLLLLLSRAIIIYTYNLKIILLKKDFLFCSLCEKNLFT